MTAGRGRAAPGCAAILRTACRGGNGGEDGGLRSCLPEKDKNKYKKRRREKRRRFRLHINIVSNKTKAACSFPKSF